MVIYTVKSGDSIYSIAREFNVPPSRIIIDNDLENPSRLIVGQTLVILFPTETYTVVGGDTLFSISKKFGVSVNQLYRNNPNLNGLSVVYPGQILNISYPEPPLGDIDTNGYIYPFVNRAVLRKTLPYLTYISIFSYTINADGTISEPPGGDEELIALAREYGTAPMMVLNALDENGNFSSELGNLMLSDEAFKEKVIYQVIETVKRKNYHGVDLDFEYISGENAASYADFGKKLNERLGDNYEVFTALAPKTFAGETGILYDGHDYEAIGKAVDAVLLMTYEWGYTYSPPMPVAPINFVRSVIEYAESVIDPKKIFMGFPNYGYNWTLPYIKGKSAAKSISNVQAVELAGEKNAAIQYKETAEAPFFNYYDHVGNGAVKHEVWFEDARSVNAKFRLPSEYGLRGIGIWNLMKYFPAMWLVANSLYRINRI